LIKYYHNLPLIINQGIKIFLLPNKARVAHIKKEGPGNGLRNRNGDEAIFWVYFGLIQAIWKKISYYLNF